MNETDDQFECILTCIHLFLCVPSSLQRNLAAIQDREICCYSISCKEKDNIGELHSVTALSFCVDSGAQISTGDVLKNPVFANSSYRFSFTLQYLSKRRYLNVQPQKFK